MKHCSQVLVVLFACLYSIAVLADNSWQPIAKQQLKQYLAPYQNLPVKGTFSQSKKLQFLTVPIRSSGEFSIDKQQAELLWQQHKPVQQQTKITQTGIYQQNPGQSDFVKLVDDTVVSQLLLAVFTGDIAEQEWFLWQYNSAEVGCIKSEILLAELAQFVQSIKLCQQQGLTQISLSEKQVETLIELTEYKE